MSPAWPHLLPPLPTIGPCTRTTRRPGARERLQGPGITFAFAIPEFLSPPMTKVGTSLALGFEGPRAPPFKVGGGEGRVIVEGTAGLHLRTRERPRSTAHALTRVNEQAETVGSPVPVMRVDGRAQHRAGCTAAPRRYCQVDACPGGAWGSQSRGPSPLQPLCPKPELKPTHQRLK